MTKKLFAVTLTTTEIVLAEDEADAVMVAQDNKGEFDFQGTAAPMCGYPGGYTPKALPWSDGEDEELTLGELVEAGYAPELTKFKQLVERRKAGG